MPKLPTDSSGQDVRTALERCQFEFRRQKGSHMILGRSEPACRVVVPDHKQVRVGTLRKIISQAGLTVEDFLKAVEGDRRPSIGIG